jgi:hypothetical protein
MITEARAQATPTWPLRQGRYERAWKVVDWRNIRPAGCTLAFVNMFDPNGIAAHVQTSYGR